MTTAGPTVDVDTEVEPTVMPPTESGEPNESSTGEQGVCGDGKVDPGEACDDANTNNLDYCTTLCRFPSCTDGLVSGNETDLDCGGDCKACAEGAVCVEGADCSSQVCLHETCVNAFSCRDLIEAKPQLPDGDYTINPDGPGGVIPFTVHCDMTHDGGGWTLIFVSSDDDQDTWTFAERTLMTTNEQVVGSLQARDRDFKSPAYHTLPFADMLFIHAPSEVWASYADVGSGTNDFGSFLASKPERVCDFDLPGDGVPLSAGSLTAGGRLCDTNLYFNRGDHEGSLATCQNLEADLNNATFGPVWNTSNNADCPFDDPATASLGPRYQCTECDPGVGETEGNGRGFGAVLELNTGVAGAGDNRVEVYVR